MKKEQIKSILKQVKNQNESGGQIDQKKKEIRNNITVNVVDIELEKIN